MSDREFRSRTSNGRTRIKICGITSVELADAAIAAGADAIGLVFATGSPRQVDRATAVAIRNAAGERIRCIGVFADNSIDEVLEWPGAMVQLHGDEDPDFVTELNERHPELLIVKGFPFDPEAVRMWDQCEALYAMLIDGATAGGGTGFNHGALARMMRALTKPVILAGGLTPENVGDAIATARPYAVDVSSGVESARGVKDPELIRAFCDAVREADRRMTRHAAK